MLRVEKTKARVQFHTASCISFAVVFAITITWVVEVVQFTRDKFKHNETDKVKSLFKLSVIFVFFLWAHGN